MKLALDQARSALSRREFPVGCVLVHDDSVVGSGARTCSSSKETNELDHAEIVALRDWIARGRKGEPGGITAYVTLEPCFMCLGALMINGISRIVFAYEDVMGGACGTDFSRPLTLGAEHMEPADMAAHIYMKYQARSGEGEIIGGFMRDESLRLFHEFFSDQTNTYLKDTYLARYTIEQGKKCNASRK